MKKQHNKSQKENDQVVEDDTFVGFNKYGPSRSQLPIQGSSKNI